eukprot:5862760-Prymnesium_polylepis.1
MPKAAKVTHPPRRPLNCESDPPLKTLLPSRGAERHAPRLSAVVASSAAMLNGMDGCRTRGVSADQRCRSNDLPWRGRWPMMSPEA